MCTLILGVSIFGAGSLLLGANRDEDPARPSEPPARLVESPPVVGGRDRVAGGTWLAVRGRSIAVAMLNRRGRPPVPPTRSRGLLALDVAVHPEPATAFESLVRTCYAPFTLVMANPERPWLLAWDGEQARMTEFTPGWHVLTHAELDDANEPRTAWLLGSLASFTPATPEQARRGVIERLSRHEAPAVCLHDGPVRTVSAAWIELGAGVARYEHAEGPPCTTPFADYSSLLMDEPVTAENA
ncbi:MAG: NRDE family protein [Candidatus Eiseniibacteriota bacterium]